MPTPDPGSSVSGTRAFLGRHALRFVNIIVFVLLVFLLFNQVDISELRTTIGKADGSLILVALSLDLPIAVLFVLRSHIALVRLGYHVEPRVLVPAIILGNVAGSLTPASSGELLRATALKGHAQIPATDGIALVLFERGVSLYLMAVGTGVAAAFVALPLAPALIVAAGALPLAMAPALGPLLLRLLPATDDRERVSLAARALGRINHARDRLAWILEDRRMLAGWVVMTVVILILSAMQVWLLARGISHKVDPAQASAAFGASQLAGIISLLPLGLGAVDGSLAALLRKFGLTLEQGASAAVLLRLVVTIPFGVTAILCYLYLKRVGDTRPATAP